MQADAQLTEAGCRACFAPHPQGLSALPANCLKLCGGFFLGSMAVSALRDALPRRWGRFVPIPMAAAIPFYIGAQLAVRAPGWRPKQA
jgi:hypothetical protein